MVTVFGIRCRCAAEYGDYTEDEFGPSSAYLGQLRLLPQQTDAIEVKIMEHHKDHLYDVILSILCRVFPLNTVKIVSVLEQDRSLKTRTKPRSLPHTDLVIASELLGCSTVQNAGSASVQKR